MASMIETAARAFASDPTEQNRGLLLAAVEAADSTENREAYMAAADFKRGEEGVVEIDDDAVVSLSDDGGAYVAAWLWVRDDEMEKFREGGE